MQELLTAISTVGFPIVAFLLMYYFAVKTVNDNTFVIRELIEEIHESRLERNRC